MKYAFASFIILAWLIFAPWIAKGYGDWRVPTTANSPLIDLLFFYLLPFGALAIAISAVRSKVSK